MKQWYQFTVTVEAEDLTEAVGLQTLVVEQLGEWEHDGFASQIEEVPKPVDWREGWGDDDSEADR